MAYIPFGYKIVEGRAVILPGEKQKVLDFLSGFLSGKSVREALEAAALPLSLTTAKKLLRRRLYLGNGFYPQMIGQELFEKVQAEVKRRTHPPTIRPQEPMDVQSLFKMRKPDAALAAYGMDPAELASAIYRNILPDPAGSVSMSAAEIQAYRKAGKMDKNSPKPEKRKMRLET